jgi:hypothetical protein
MIAQQIDIYPTILDMIGYDKPFRKVVVCLTRIAVPFAINSTGTIYQFAKGNYIIFDGKKKLGFMIKTIKL